MSQFDRELNFREHNFTDAEEGKEAKCLRGVTLACVTHNGCVSPIKGPPLIWLWFLPQPFPSLEDEYLVPACQFPRRCEQDTNYSQHFPGADGVTMLCLKWAAWWTCQHLTFFYLPNANFNSLAHTHYLCLGHVPMKWGLPSYPLHRWRGLKLLLKSQESSSHKCKVYIYKWRTVLCSLMALGNVYSWGMYNNNNNSVTMSN